MDAAVKKAYSLIQKLQKKYGIRIPDRSRSLKKVLQNVEGSEVFVSKEVVSSHLLEDWCLLDQKGHLHRLPMTMIFLGREECDVVVKSQTVDKRHAVITFDHYLDRFKIKDLSTINGTFVNEARIPEQEYVTLEHMDSLRLGYDSMLYHMERLPKSTLDNCTDHVLSPSDTIPQWVVEDGTHLAECEGCIAEQQITHTCEEHGNEDHKHLPEMYSSDRTLSCPNLGSNTWPRKRVRNMQHVTTVFNDKDLDNSGITSTSYTNGDCVDPSQNRILQEKGAAPQNLPPELETVKKCTPLYGQPEWWGEDEAWQQGETIIGDTRQQKGGRPSSLILTRSIEEQRLHSGIDLLHKKITPERDKERSPPRKMTTSMSKDSLSSHFSSCQNTPDTPGEKYAFNNKVMSSDKDSSSVKAYITPTQKPLKCPDGGASMAFTVQLDDDTPKMKIEGSLSAFVPSKIRRSFRERSEKSKSSSKETSPCALEQEVVDISPASQAKIEDLWNSENNNNKRPRSTDAGPTFEEGEKLDSIPVKGPKTPKMKRSKISCLVKPKNALKTKNNSTATSTSQVSDSATYLIDRMFTDGNVKKDDTLKVIASPFTEHTLYKEAKQFNKNIKNTNEEKTEEDNIKSYDSRTYRVVKSKIFRNPSQNEDLSPVVEVKKDPGPEVKPTVEEGDINSEAGTYTIDGEKKSKAEEDARKNIDKVFGLAQDDDISINRPVIAGSRSFPSAREVTLVQLKREVEELEIRWGQKQLVDRLEVDIGSEEMLDDDIGSEGMPELTYESPVVSVPSSAPQWVNQWAALTNQKARNTTDRVELMSPTSPAFLFEKEIMEKSPLSQKQSSGLARKRPGTGRRLPSIPPERSSPSSSECSSKVGDKTVDSSGDGNSPNSIKQKTVKISSHVATQYQDTNSKLVSRTKFDNDSEHATLVNGHDIIPSHTSSNVSVASMETDLLLRDTETVMAAMEARMVTKSHPVQNSVTHRYANVNRQCDSDTETSSNVAVANGDDDYVKPTYYDSPRQNLSKAKLKNDTVTSRPPLARTKSASARSTNIGVDRSSVLRRQKTFTKKESVVSDVVSEINVIDSNSNMSDMSSDHTESSQDFNRKGSKGKGAIAMTRPNRAFQLRRQRAEEPDTPKSSSTSTASGSTRLSLGSASLNTTTRTSSRTRPRPNSMGLTSDRQLDSAKSEMSLGAQIVKKSRDNLTSQTIDRKDGGRHSLRMLRTKSTSDAVLNTSTESTSCRKAKFKAWKSNLKTTSSTSDSYGLSVTGVRNDKSTSQPSSRSNSPKSAERNAWRRRKEYDPRKAVAEAKAKSKEVKTSTTYSAMNSAKKIMGRSQSFTNSTDLARSYSGHRIKDESTSSVEHLSQVTNEANDTFDVHGPKRSFLPYSNPLQQNRLYHSVDEDNIRLVKSTQDLSRSMLSSNPNMSAFTPPPPKSASPVSPPPPNQHYHRRSFDLHDISNGFYGTLSRKYSDTSLIQSYDNIIVSSIYQLSLKLKTAMDRTMLKLRDSQRIDSSSPSPIDDLLNTSSSSDMPAWKSANQELAGILKNLRKIEHYVHVVDTVLFPDDDQSTEVSGLSRGEKRRYLQEIERIRSELAGFQPIENADVWNAHDSHEDQVESDCEELGGDDYY